MVYYKSINRFIWFTTNSQTGLDGLLTDLHTGFNVLLADLQTGLIGLRQNHKPARMVYYRSTHRFIWFTTNPHTGLSGLLQIHIPFQMIY